MSAHTPGPWFHVGGLDKRMAPFIRVVGDPVGVAAVAQVCGRGPYSEQAANARLIAAAPELLAALQEVVMLAREIHEHWDNDRDSKVGKNLLALAGFNPKYDKRMDEIHAAIAKAEG